MNLIYKYVNSSSNIKTALHWVLFIGITALHSYVSVYWILLQIPHILFLILFNDDDYLYWLENKYDLKEYSPYEKSLLNEKGDCIGSCNGTEVIGKLTGKKYK